MKQNLKFGDILYRNKGFVEHAGVYYGNEKVVHNSPDNNVQLCSIEHFAENKNIKVVSSHLSVTQAQQLQQRAEQKLNQPKRYNPLTFNCEQLVTDLLEGVPTSKQVQGAALGGLTATALAKSMDSKRVFWFAAIGAVLGCYLVNTQRKYDHVIEYPTS